MGALPMPRDPTLFSFSRCARRLGLLGGTFDPVHFGHLDAGRALRGQLKLDACVFIPAHQNPLKADSPAASDLHRFEMLRLALQREEGLFVAPIELELSPAAPGKAPSYTVETVERVRAEAPEETELFLLIGSDLLPQLSRWRAVDRLFSLCTIVPFVRDGHPSQIEAGRLNLAEDQAAQLRANLREVPPWRLSACDLRQALRGGRSVEAFAPPEVIAYIHDQRLYR